MKTFKNIFHFQGKNELWRKSASIINSDNSSSGALISHLIMMTLVVAKAKWPLFKLNFAEERARAGGPDYLRAKKSWVQFQFPPYI